MKSEWNWSGIGVGTDRKWSSIGAGTDRNWNGTGEVSRREQIVNGIELERQIEIGMELERYRSGNR